MGSALNGSIGLLSALNSAKERKLSVSDLSQRLGRTESEILECVRAVNQQDYIIDETAHGELCLIRKLDLLDEDEIYKKCRGKGRVSVMESLASTNTEMLLHSANMASGDVILAEIQYGGRSRRETKWYSPIGSQVTFSICHIFPAASDLQGLSVAAGISLATALCGLGIADVKVKWPNDIYVQDRKICGILVETLTNARGIYVVVGLGLNVHPEGLEEVDIACTSLEDAGCTLCRSEVAILLVNALRDLFDTYGRHGFAAFRQDFARLDYLKDRALAVKTDKRHLEGIGKGVNDLGELMLEDSTGQLFSITAGHLTIKA